MQEARQLSRNPWEEKNKGDRKGLGREGAECADMKTITRLLSRLFCRGFNPRSDIRVTVVIDPIVCGI